VDDKVDQLPGSVWIVTGLAPVGISVDVAYRSRPLEQALKTIRRTAELRSGERRHRSGREGVVILIATASLMPIDEVRERSAERVRNVVEL
jgi:hypothetical protein